MGKKLVKILIAIVVIAVLSGITIGTGMMSGIGEVQNLLHFDIAAILKCALIVAFVLAIKWIIQLILALCKPKSGRGASAVTIIDSLVQYIAAIVIICWGLVTLGVNVSTVLASVGILALVIGFGAESLIEDVITGIFMMFENQYNVGDIIEVDGFRGTVAAIGVRTTTLEDVGGNKKIINNSAMKNILNRSTITSKAVSDIGISYDADLRKLESLIPDMVKQIAEESEILKTVTYLGVQELGDSAVVLRFVGEVDEQNIYSGQRELNRALYLKLLDAGFEVPFQQVDVHQK